MDIKRHLPNFVTSLNLLAGCVALVALYHKYIVLGASLVYLAAVFDFFDGALARLLNVKSEFGKEMDSLADVVSFGVVPGMVLYAMIQWFSPVPGQVFTPFLAYTALLIPVFSALRLAKFNLDTRQSTYFLGLPTPANALFIASFPLVTGQRALVTFPLLENFYDFLFNPYTLAITAILLSLLLVSNIPFMSLKFRNLAWKGNEARYILLGLAVILVILMKYMAIPLIFFIYTFISLIMKKNITGVRTKE